MNSTPADKAKTKAEKTNIKNIDQELTEKLEAKFNQIKEEITNLNPIAENFKDHALPLARIKRIMKLDDEVKMISGESPVLFSKACELFIIELAYRSWVHTLDNNRRTLQKSDIANAIGRTEYYDFLMDIVPESNKNKLLYCSNFPNANFSNINQIAFPAPLIDMNENK